VNVHIILKRGWIVKLNTSVVTCTLNIHIFGLIIT